MAISLADKVTNLTSARYFAARGFDWLCFDLTAGHGMNIPKVAAMREWVEGPAIMLYLPWGFRQEEDQALADLQPEGWMAGHFASPDALPPAGELIKEWVLETVDDAKAVGESIGAWPAHTRHLLRMAGLTPEDQLLALQTLQRIAPEAGFIVQLFSDPTPYAPCLSLCRGICVTAPDEAQTGLLSFEALDELLDALEELRD